jgi:hypothetical protein
MFGKYVLLTIDDGSGSTVVVKIKRLAANISAAIDCPSNTSVSNVNVRAGLGFFNVQIDDTAVDIGTVIKVKCTIEEFRGVKQLDLQRVSVIKTTAEEIKAWDGLSQFKKSVLSSPWALTNEELEILQQEIVTENNDIRMAEIDHEEHLKRHKERKKEKAETWRKREVKREIRRRNEEVLMNAGALI